MPEEVIGLVAIEHRPNHKPNRVLQPRFANEGSLKDGMGLPLSVEADERFGTLRSRQKPASNEHACRERQQSTLE